MKHALIGLLITALSAGILALLIIFGGWFPVSAIAPEPPLVQSLIHTAYEKAVARQASDLTIPSDLDDETRVLRGAYNFQAMCSLCHTPPGAERSVQAQGMNPSPPVLSELLNERTPAEAFWVIENGVRMTAMPAFGPTHENEELWALIAFLQDSQAQDADGYRTLVSAARQRFSAGDGHGHSHGEDAESDVNQAPHHHEDGEHHNDEHADDHRDGHHDDEMRTDTGHHGHADADRSGHHHDAATPATMSARMSHALSEGDSAVLQDLLAEDVLIFESGGLEDGFADYASHHMPADMAFLRRIQRKPLSQKIFELGDHALVTSRVRLSGEFKDKPVDLLSTETLLLKLTDDGEWKVQHIHWSSGEAR